MNYAKIDKISVADGIGIRTVLYVSGCSLHCKGCHNPTTHDFNGGGLVPVSLVCEAIDELEYHTGITFSGGDPMYQPVACNEIAAYAKSKGYNIWVYTGFTFEELMKMSESMPIYKEFLEKIDILVDGQYEDNKRDLNLAFRGSSNQRVIDIKKSLAENKIITKY